MCYHDYIAFLLLLVSGVTYRASQVALRLNEVIILHSADVFISRKSFWGKANDKKVNKSLTNALNIKTKV